MLKIKQQDGIAAKEHSAAKPQPQSAPEFLAELMDVQPQLYKDHR
jgi:hypothetical protein